MLSLRSASGSGTGSETGSVNVLPYRAVGGTGNLPRVLTNRNSGRTLPAPPADTMRDVLTTTEAATRKGCTRQAINNAIQRGEINAARLGRSWAVSDDAALATWSVKETGGRAHRRATEAEDVSADT